MSIQQYIQAQNEIRAPAQKFGINLLSRDSFINGSPANIVVQSGDLPTFAQTDNLRYNVLYIREGDSYAINSDGSVNVQFNGGGGIVYQGFSILIDDDKTRFILEDDEAEIARLYQAAFGRVPDESGLEFWLNAYKNGLASYSDIADNFINSPEFKERFGDFKLMTPEDFITLLYDNILDRQPDAGGYDFWVRGYKNGATAEDIVEEFARSQENQIKSQEWLSNLKNGDYVGPGYDYQLPTTVKNLLLDLIQNHTFIDLTNIKFPFDEQSIGDGTQLIEAYPLTVAISDFGDKVTFSTNNILGSGISEYRSIILPDAVTTISPQTFSDFNPNIRNTQNMDLVAPSLNDSVLQDLEWTTPSVANNVRYFFNDDHRDIIIPFLHTESMSLNPKFPPVEVHNFKLGQDIIDADAQYFRELDLDSAFLEFKDLDPKEFILLVLDDIEADRDTIASALTDFDYDEVGAVLVHNGFDIEVFLLQSLFVIDDANTLTIRNELDGNNQINSYELAHAMTLKNLEITTESPSVFQDVNLPHTDLIFDTDNIKFDYLFL